MGFPLQGRSLGLSLHLPGRLVPMNPITMAILRLARFLPRARSCLKLPPPPPAYLISASNPQAPKSPGALTMPHLHHAHAHPLLLHPQPRPLHPPVPGVPVVLRPAVAKIQNVQPLGPDPRKAAVDIKDTSILHTPRMANSCAPWRAKLCSTTSLSWSPIGSKATPATGHCRQIYARKVLTSLLHKLAFLCLSIPNRQ